MIFYIIVNLQTKTFIQETRNKPKMEGCKKKNKQKQTYA